MKILNQIKSMNILKYLFFTIFISSNLILKAINPPTNITATVSCGKLTSTWTAPTNVTSYELKVYKGVYLSGNPFTNISSTITLSASATSYTYPSNANEVAEPGDYYFEIVALQSGSFSSTPAYTPTNMNVSYNALNPTITNITCNSFTASWDNLITGCGSSNGITYRYSVDQYSNNTYIGTLVNNVTTTSTSVAITGAMPNSFYKLSVQAKSNSGTTTTYIGTTTSSAYQTSGINNVSGFSISNISGTPTNNYCTSFTAIWDKNTCATDYELKLYRNIGGGVFNLENTINVVGTTAANQVYTFNSGLISGGVYKVEIKAIYNNNGNFVAESGVVTSNTINLPTLIAAPTNVRLVSKCGRTFTVAWDAVSDSRVSGYMCDLSTSSNFTTGNFVLGAAPNAIIQNYNIPGGTSTNTLTFELPTFSPFTSRTVQFRIKTLNSNNECNSGYTNLLSIILRETPASLNVDANAYFSQVEGTNSFLTNYWAFSRPHIASGFSADACVTGYQIKVEMANADGTLFVPTATGTSNVRWIGPTIGSASINNAIQQLNVSFSNYIIQNGGVVSNYNGIGTSNNLNNSSFILSPETKYGPTVLSTGYHKITLVYWIGITQHSLEYIIKIINNHTDFSLQYPVSGSTAAFTNYYFNSSSSSYNFGPGFNCRDIDATINAKSNLPAISVDPPYSGLTWDDIYPPLTKIIFSKATNPAEFYVDGSNVNQIIGTKTLNTNELVALRNGTLNLINVFNSLNVVGNINHIGIYTGPSYGSSPLTSTTKIINFGYTAIPTNVALTYKCANDISISWSGNGNLNGTDYLVTIGRSYDPNSNTISNFVTSGTSPVITYNNYQMSTNQFQALFNYSFNSTFYVQIKAVNTFNNCTSQVSNIYSFTYIPAPVYATNPTAGNNGVDVCFGNPVNISNISYDANCVNQLRLIVVDAVNGNPLFTSNYESAASFITHFNTLTTTNIPAGEQYPAGSVQNYINYCRSGGSSLNPMYEAYNGENDVNSGVIFEPFMKFSPVPPSQASYNFNSPGRTRIEIEGRYNSGAPVSTWYSSIFNINSPNNYVLLKKDDGTFTNNDYFPVPTQKGYLVKQMQLFLNKKSVSIVANNNTPPSNCIGSVYIEFANSVTGFATSFASGTPAPLSGTNLSNYLSTTGLDLIAYGTALGKINNSYIRITYMTNPNSNKFVSAIYSLNAQPWAVYYIKSNTAYETEKQQGFRNIVLEQDPTVVYTYDHNNHFYSNGSHVLIPDNINTTVPLGNFYGFMSGSPSSSNFQWDANLLDFSNRGSEYSPGWDKQNMFVSPFSIMPMNICEVLDVNNNGLSCTNSTLIDITNTVYNSNFNSSGNYVGTGTYTIDNLIMDQGLVDNGSDNDYIVQQSADDNSYCVQTYGYGWRLPTATEIGKELDLPVSTFSTNPAYYQNSTGKIWSSSLWQNNTSWWEAIGTTSNLNMLSNNSFYSTSNYVRCVYPTH